MDFGKAIEGMGHTSPREGTPLPSEMREEDPEKLFLRLQGKLINDLAKIFMEIYGIPQSYRLKIGAILAGILGENFNGKPALFKKLRDLLFEDAEYFETADLDEIGDQKPIMNEYFYERLCAYMSDGERVEEIIHIAGFLLLNDLVVFYGPEFCRRAAEAQIPMRVSSIQETAQHDIMRAANGTHS